MRQPGRIRVSHPCVLRLETTTTTDKNNFYHVIEQARRIHAIEIKSAKTPNDSFLMNMDKFEKSIAPLAGRSVVYSGDEWPISGGGKFINFRNVASLVDAIR